MRAKATNDSPYPKWLPSHMRHTTPPVKRLRALLASVPIAVRNNNELQLNLRARKIQHLCRQIDPAIGGEAPPVRIRIEQLLEILALGTTFLDSTGNAQPNRGVISSIYDCAALLLQKQTAVAEAAGATNCRHI